MIRTENSELEVPFEPTGEYVPRVTISETDPVKLDELWQESRERFRVHRKMLAEEIDQLEAIERQQRVVFSDRIDIGGKHWRRMLDDIDTLHEWEKQLNRACDECEARYMAFAEKLGMEGSPIKSKWLTVTIDEKMKAVYEPQNYEKIIAGLVGIDAEAVADAIKAMPVIEAGSRLVDAVRAGIRIGNLDVIQRRFTDTKVEALAMSDAGLPEGLSITPQKFARKSRAVGTVPVDRE